MNILSVKRIRYFTVACIISLAITGCQADNEDYDEEEKITFILKGDANGSQERPNSVSTNGTGTITGNYNKNTNILTYNISWTGLSGPPINMHFHGPATTSTAAGVAIGIPLPSNPLPAGSVSGSANLTDQQETELLGGLWYYNIHTDLNKSGEIRGQISTQ